MDGPAMAAAVRRQARANRWIGSTRGAAPGQVQCNVVILSGEDAQAFAAWCALNPAVAPVLGRTEPGDPRLPGLGDDIDLRVDLPAYRLFDNGKDIGRADDILDRWQSDWVGFAFGCSFSLEDAIRDAGIPLAYEDRGFGGAIYVTDRPTEPYGAYAGPLVVSMRPIAKASARAAVELSRSLPQLHGAPVHVGDPAEIGIVLEKPLESLGALSITPDEVPVFWACGVTTQFVIERARHAFAVTHVSSQMLVTDRRIADMKQR